MTTTFALAARRTGVALVLAGAVFGSTMTAAAATTPARPTPGGPIGPVIGGIEPLDNPIPCAFCWF